MVITRPLYKIPSTVPEDRVLAAATGGGVTMGMCAMGRGEEVKVEGMWKVVGEGTGGGATGGVAGAGGRRDCPWITWDRGFRPLRNRGITKSIPQLLSACTCTCIQYPSNRDTLWTEECPDS